MAERVIDLEGFIAKAETPDEFYTLIEHDCFVRVELEEEEVIAKVLFQESGNTRTSRLSRPSFAIRNSKAFVVLSTLPNWETEVGATILSLAVLEKGGKRDGQFTVYSVVRVEAD